MKKQWQLVQDGIPVTGASTETAVTIRRESDGYVFDFTDAAFKASGWTALTAHMTEVNASILPGLYEFEYDPSDWQDDIYQFYAVYNGTQKEYASGDIVMKDGEILEQAIATAIYELTHTPDGDPISRIIPSPASPGMCRLYEFVSNQPGNEALASVTATCRILGPYDSGQQLHTIETVQGTYGVDEDHPELGPFLYFDVVFGARAAIEIVEANINKTVIVPREATARIAKLRGV